MPKPPYRVEWSTQAGHVDRELRTVHFRGGPTLTDIDRWTPIRYNNQEHYHTSISTKPWPNGVPPIWTNYHRNHNRVLRNSASGTVIWTPEYSPEYWSYASRHWTCSGGWSNVFERTSDAIWQPRPSDYPDRDELDNKIRVKLLDPWNAAVMMAETSQAVEGVTGALKRLYRAATFVKRKQLRKALKELGDPKKKKLSARRRRSLKREIPDPKLRQFASDWLELQYGWLPLLSDINGLITSVQNKDKSHFIRAHSVVKTQRTSNHVARSRMEGGLSYNRDELLLWNGIGYLAEIAIDDPYLYRLAANGLTNPAVVLWEKVPWSFVVDWFLPVGTFLQSAGANFGLKIKGTLFIKGRREIHFTSSTLGPASPADNAFGFGVYAREWNTYSRTICEFPSAKLPSFKNPISVTHGANTLALLTKTLKR